MKNYSFFFFLSSTLSFCGTDHTCVITKNSLKFVCVEKTLQTVEIETPFKYTTLKITEYPNPSSFLKKKNSIKNSFHHKNFFSLKEYGKNKQYSNDPFTWKKKNSFEWESVRMSGNCLSPAPGEIKVHFLGVIPDEGHAVYKIEQGTL